MNDSALIVLVVEKQYQHSIVDALINFDHASGFTLFEVNGFSQSHHHYDLSEQVRGHRKMIRIEVIIKDENRQNLFDLLSDIPKREPFHYWVYPVLSEGRLE